MEISEKIIKLAEEIKKHRISTKIIEELKIKNEALEYHSKKLEKNVKILKLNTIKQNYLLKQITELKESENKLKINLEKSEKAYTFIVTTPTEVSNTICSEINKEILKAKYKVLICSPWITYIGEEFSSLKNNKIDLKIITRCVKEDINKGTTDLEKFRTLKDDFNAGIRYNNDLHAKIVIIDNSVAIISSANLTKKGLLSASYESGICIKDKNIVDKVSMFFNEIWEESKPLTKQFIKNVSSNKR